MASSFVAYIDESGDEGFHFRPDGSGSSRWFVLTALVIRKEEDTKTIVPAVAGLRELLRKPAKHPLHFRELKHEQRVPISRCIGELPVRTIHIAIHKPCIREPENFQQEAYSLYRYCSRLLLERLSWLCRDSRLANQGDGKVELIYSNRSKMSYEDLTGYLEHLKREPNPSRVRIEWSVIDPNLVRAVNHDQLAGLQLADAAASGCFFAVRNNAYGDTEPRYLQLMRPTLYRRRSQLEGYGMKFWCDCDEPRQSLLQSLSGQ